MQGTLIADESANGGTDGTPALADLLQAVAQAARLFSVTAYNTGLAALYVQVHDSASTPAANAVPKFQVKVQADDDRSIDYATGRIFKNGIFIGASTSPTGYVAAGTTALMIDCTFRRKGA